MNLQSRISGLSAVFILGGIFATVVVPASGALADQIERAAPEPTPASSLLHAEYAVFGLAASSTFELSEVGGHDIGGVRADDGGGPSNLGRKVKAGILSLLLPGAGQYYNGDTKKAYIFAGIEAAVWASYLTFHISAHNREDTYIEYAQIYAGIAGDHSGRYWQAVGRHLDSDAYNEEIRREARAASEEPSGLIAPADAWQWRNEDRLEAYQALRRDANKAYDRRDFMTLFAIINRAAAVFDAVRHSVDDQLSGDVLGFHVAFEVSPSLHNPRTECVITRKF